MALSVLKRELWSKSLVAWYLYDFANSFLVINLTLYFSQWVVADRGFSDFAFALPFMASTAVLVLLSPYLGELGDRRGSHRAILIAGTLAAAASGVGIYAAGRFIPDQALGAAAALIAYGLFLFFLQAALVPYYAFLKHLAPAEHYGKVSGFGFSANQLGYIAGILLTLPLFSGPFAVFGFDRLAPILPAAAAFLIFSLPAFTALRSPPPTAVRRGRLPFRRTLLEGLRASGRYPGVRPLLLAFYLFSDAITSLTFFSAIYLEQVFAMPDAAKAALVLIVIVAYGAGSFASGVFSDRIGHRRVLLWSLAATALAILPIALVRGASLAFVLFPVFGLAIGMVLTVSRAYFASLVPVAESGRFFGLYTFADRFASVIGPAIWSAVVWTLAAYHPWNYRAAALAMAGLVALGIVPLVWRRKLTPAVEWE